MNGKEMWTKPYVQAGISHTLSSKALTEVARDVLSRGFSFRFLAPGASMSPFIRDGDVITLAPFDAAAVTPGDVVAFIEPENGRLIVHRIVSVSEDRCCIKGDNNPASDGEYSFDSIFGMVTYVQRGERLVRLGLGPERALIALLSRWGWLSGCISVARAFHSVFRGYS